jgi:hypothetical protein
MNRWILARTTRDNPSSDDVRDDLYDSLVRWSGQSVDIYWFSGDGVYVGAFDLVTIPRAERSPTGLPPFRYEDTIAFAQDVSLGPMPTIDSGGQPLLYFEVQFAYRGYHESLPWPVSRKLLAPGLPSPADQCPTGCDMMLYAAGTALQDAPPEKSLGELLSETSRRMTGQAASVLVWPALLGLGVVAAIAAGKHTIGNATS